MGDEYPKGPTRFGLCAGVPAELSESMGGPLMSVGAVVLDWPAIMGILMCHICPEYGPLLARADEAEAEGADPARLAKMIEDLTADGVRRRYPSELKMSAAIAYAVAFAPEKFEGAVRALLAEAEAWAVKDCEDDDAEATRIMEEAHAREARERLTLRGQGRRPALLRRDLMGALNRLRGEGRPLTRANVVEVLRAADVIVSDRTLSAFAAGYGMDWEGYVAEVVAELDHLERERAKPPIDIDFSSVARPLEDEEIPPSISSGGEDIIY